MATGHRKDDGSNVQYLKFKTMDAENSHFEVWKKNPTSGKYEKGADITHFSGYLSKVDKSSFTHKERTHVTGILTFKDGDEILVLESTYDFMFRGLINALSNIEKLERIKLSLYQSKKDGKVKLWIDNGQDKPMWRYDWTHQQTMIREYDKGGGEMGKDYSKLNTFFQSILLDDIGDLIKDQDIPENKAPEPSGTPISDTPPSSDLPIEEEPDPIGDVSDDLPF